MEQTEFESLLRHRRAANLASIVLGIGPITYLLGLILGLTGEQMWLLLGLQLLVALGPYHLALALPLQRQLMRQAWEHRPEDPPGHRLARLLELPQRLHLLHLGLLILLQGGACLGYCLYFGRETWRVLPCLAALAPLIAFILLGHLHQVEQSLQPQVVDALHRAPTTWIPRRPLFWRRLGWQLLYTLGLTLACVLWVPGIVVWHLGNEAVDSLAWELAGRGVPHAVQLLQRQLEWLRGQGTPVLAMGFFLGGLGVLSTWEVARRITQGTRHLRHSLKEAVRGTHPPPRWFSSDELGRLTIAVTRALLRLRGLARRLRGSSQQLAHSARELRALQARQLESLKRQVSALARARTRVQVLQERSEASAREAEELLALASQTEATHRSGRAALEQGLDSLSAVRTGAEALASRIDSLRTSAGRLSRLTGLVRDVANQSRMVAFNASIEAAVAKEAGVDFSQVATQARALAEQSLRSTQQVRAHLQGMSDALHEAVKTTRDGAVGAAEGVQRIQASGEALRQLAAAADESTRAVQQIVQVLGQQNGDIARLSHAISHLSHVTTRTLGELETAASVTLQVEGLVRQLRAPAGSEEPGEPEGSDTREVLEPARLLRALLREQWLTLGLWLVPGACLAQGVLGLEPALARDMALGVLAPLCVVGGVLVPPLTSRGLVDWALRPPARLGPEQRLRRVLELPRRLGVIQTLLLTGLGLLASVLGGMRSERGALPILVCAVLLMMLAALVCVPPMLRLEDEVRPLALELFQLHPEVELPWRWPFYRSLSWYLPYVMGLTACCVLVAVAAWGWRLCHEAARRLMGELALQGARAEEVIYPWLSGLGVELAWALVLPGALLLWHAFRLARAMTHQMARGTRELEASLASIAEGVPRLPRWVSTDELGGLSLATTALFPRLWSLTREVEQANDQLDEAARQLGLSQREQAHGLADQWKRVSEALATAREVEQASTLAAHGMANVLATAERGEGLRRAGEHSLAQARRGLEALRAYEADMVGRLGRLEEHARGIGAITALLRELARECDTVALNASLQAVRTGERGRIFLVIARELRMLAERSSQTTREADRLLEAFMHAAREVAGVVREVAGALRGGLEQAHHSAEELRLLSQQVQGSRTAAWRIAEALREQHQDIAEVSVEMERVTGTAEELTSGVEASARLTATVGRVQG